MIVVTGATGQLGSRIVAHLLDRVSPDTVGVSVRDVERAGALAARGVRVRAGDFTDPAALRSAFEGADQVLVVSAAIRGGGAVEANITAIDAAREAGARRVLYTSHQAASRDSLFAAQPTHAATEEHLAGTGLPFTALRNGFYASTLGYYTRGAVETGRFTTPQDGPVSWTAHADLAEVAAIALADEGVLDGVSAPLTAPETVDLDTVAGMLSDLSGRRVEHVVVDDEEWAATAVAQGVPAAAAEFSLGVFRAARRGEFDVTGPTLERVLGRPAAPARAVLQELVTGR